MSEYTGTVVSITDGFIRLLTHGAGRWKAGSYNLYRNIKIRELDDAGAPKQP